jgi:hypothetical protein
MTTQNRATRPAKNASAAKKSSKPVGRPTRPRTPKVKPPEAAPAVRSALSVPEPVRPTVPPRARLAKPPAAQQMRPIRQACKLSEGEYETLSSLKKRCQRRVGPTKRGEILRVGLVALSRMDDEALLRALTAAGLA